jgi:hypothetical protein
MTTRDQARADLLRLHWLHASGRGDGEEAAQIVKRYGMEGQPFLAISEAIEEVSKGQVMWIDERMEASE